MGMCSLGERGMRGAGNWGGGMHMDIDMDKAHTRSIYPFSSVALYK